MTSGSTAETMVRSSAPTKTGRQTSARISRGYCCARDIQRLRSGRRQLWCGNVDWLVDAGDLDQPAVAAGFVDVNLHRRGGTFLNPEIDRVREFRLERGAHQLIQLVAADIAPETQRVARLHFLA